MFDMGFVEILVIGIVALVVIGPERLPSVARTVGTYVGKIRRFVTNVKSEVEQELRTEELTKMLQSQQDELNSLKQMVDKSDLAKDMADIGNTLQSETNEAKSSFEKIMADAEAARSNNDVLDQINTDNKPTPADEPAEVESEKAADDAADTERKAG